MQKGLKDWLAAADKVNRRDSRMNTYFEQMILSASPVELVRILYQRVVSTVRDAREHLSGGRIAERSGSINQAYDALAELIASLRREEAPELADRLRALYCYMQQRLLEANFQQKDAPLKEVLDLLTILADAWNPVPDGAQHAAASARAPGMMDSTPLGRNAVMA